MMRGSFTTVLGWISLLATFATYLALACVDPEPTPSSSPEVPLPSGFTQLSYGRTLYVSSSKGSDGNPGTQEKPLKTLPAALGKLDANQSDSVLLARGDTFILSSDATLNRSGSDAQKLIVGAYGLGARPIVTPYGFNFTKALSHLAIQGLHFQTTEAVNGYAIRYVGQAGSDFLIEDNELDGPFFQSLAFDAQGSTPYLDLKLRRNVIHDSWGKTLNDFSQCVYVANVKGLSVFQNVFDHCGYTGAQHNQGTIFNHALYAQKNTFQIVSQGNIVTRNQDAYQMREGGVANQNFFYGNAIHLSFNESNGVISNNVMLHANDISPANPRGIGISLDGKNTQKPGNQIQVTHNALFWYDSIKPFGMAISSNSNPAIMTVSNNRWYGFPQGLFIPNSPHVTQSGNVAENRPEKDIGDYLASVGIQNGKLGDFITQIRLQSSQHWNENYTGEALTTWFLSH